MTGDDLDYGPSKLSSNIYFVGILYYLTTLTGGLEGRNMLDGDFYSNSWSEFSGMVKSNSDLLFIHVCTTYGRWSFLDFGSAKRSVFLFRLKLLFMDFSMGSIIRGSSSALTVRTAIVTSEVACKS